MRRILSSCLALAACLFSTARAEEPHRFAVLANDPNNTYDAAILSGIADTLARSGGTIDPFYAGFDPSVQDRQCRDAVASGKYDAVVVLAADPVAITRCVNRARRAGIPVAAADLPIGAGEDTVQPQLRGEVAASFITAAQFEQAVVDIIPPMCDGLAACNILYVAGVEAFPFDRRGIEAIQRAADANPAIHLVEHDEAFYDTATAHDVVGKALDAHPGGINVILASGDQMALGAEQAASERGVPVRILGGGAGASALQAVREGRWFATFNALPRTEGYFVTKLLVHALRKPGSRPRGVDPIAGADLPTWWTAAALAQFPKFEGEWPGP